MCSYQQSYCYFFADARSYSISHILINEKGRLNNVLEDLQQACSLTLPASLHVCYQYLPNSPTYLWLSAPSPLISTEDINDQKRVTNTQFNFERGLIIPKTFLPYTFLANVKQK